MDQVIFERFVKPPIKTKPTSNVLWSLNSEYKVIQNKNDKSEEWKGDFSKIKKSTVVLKQSIDSELYANTLKILDKETEKVANIYLDKSNIEHENIIIKKSIKIPVRNNVHILIPISIGVVTVISLYLIFKYRI